ncbi:MAG: hypothetical protein ACRENB_04820 [Gemmatimonadales bacterium]
MLIVDADRWILYELFAAYPTSGGWRAGSGAIFDLTRTEYRPAGWTSADAAGLPILPGLVRWDEVEAGEIRHALRFTIRRTRRAYVHQVVLLAVRRYGMMVADNGSDWFLSGVADARWNDAEMNALKAVRGRDFEVVRMGTVTTSAER